MTNNESKIKLNLRPGTINKTYLNQISSHILSSGEKALEANEIRKKVVNKLIRIQLYNSSTVMNYFK